MSIIKKLISLLSDKKYSDPQTNIALAEIASFLIADYETIDIPLPLRKNLDSEKLDYSLESLHEVDSYLNIIHNKKKELTEAQLLKVVLRCGSYAGEVIKINSAKKFCWIKYEDALVIDPVVKNIEKSSLSFYILYSEPRNFSFPIAKAAKFISNGPEDSLYAFASIVGEFVVKK